MSKPSIKKPAIQLVLTNAGGFVEEFVEMVVERDEQQIYSEMVQALKNRIKE